MAKAQGRDWRDPEGGVEIGMGRQAQGTEGGGVKEKRGQREGGGGCKCIATVIASICRTSITPWDRRGFGAGGGIKRQ